MLSNTFTNERTHKQITGLKETGSQQIKMSDTGKHQSFFLQ